MNIKNHVQTHEWYKTGQNARKDKSPLCSHGRRLSSLHAQGGDPRCSCLPWGLCTSWGEIWSLLCNLFRDTEMGLSRDGSCKGHLRATTSQVQSDHSCTERPLGSANILNLFNAFFEANVKDWTMRNSIIRLVGIVNILYNLYHSLNCVWGKKSVLQKVNLLIVRTKYQCGFCRVWNTYSVIVISRALQFFYNISQ